MSDVETIQCVLVMSEPGEVRSTIVTVGLNSVAEATGLFNAIRAKQELYVSASALKFYDKAFTFADRPAPQYRGVAYFPVAVCPACHGTGRKEGESR